MEITREGVRRLLFGDEDVLSEKEQKSIRRYKLNRALVLGNLYKRKVKIHLKTTEGVFKRLDTTIWGVGEEFVSLKDGVSVPIRGITDIDFS